jgi:hypothetical protein
VIFITSFFEITNLPEGVKPWSAAVYQPKGYELPKAEWTDIRDKSGRWIRPREFIGTDNPPAAYREALYELYNSRMIPALQWYNKVRGTDVALCCWCPHDKAAQRQLEEFGSFICHTAVLGEWLHSTTGVPVWYDSARLQMLPLTQKGLTSI